MEASAFAQAGVLVFFSAFAPFLVLSGSGERFDFDPGGIVEPQGQLVAVDADLQRIAHRRVAHGRHLRTGNEPHVEEVLPQGTVAADSDDAGGLC